METKLDFSIDLNDVFPINIVKQGKQCYFLKAEPLPCICHEVTIEKGPGKVEAMLEPFWANPPLGRLAPTLQRLLPPPGPTGPVIQANRLQVWGYSQFCDILGDALGQRLEVLVAAPYHGVQAGALLGALWAGQAPHLLLTWKGRCDILVSQGPGFLGKVPRTPFWESFQVKTDPGNLSHLRPKVVLEEGDMTATS